MTFSYSDGSNTTTSRFLTSQHVPGRVTVDAGTFAFEGTEFEGPALFEPSPQFVQSLREHGLRVYVREVLARAILQVPLGYLLDALERLRNVEIMGVLGMYMSGVCEDDITAVLARIPDASPMDVASERMMKKHHG